MSVVTQVIFFHVQIEELSHQLQDLHLSASASVEEAKNTAGEVIMSLRCVGYKHPVCRFHIIACGNTCMCSARAHPRARPLMRSVLLLDAAVPM